MIQHQCAKCGAPFQGSNRRQKFCSIACYKRTPIERIFHKTKKTESCWIWNGSLNDHGYGYFKISGRKNARVHRFVWEHFFGPIPDGLEVCHKCDVRRCVNPSHLFLGTHDFNMKDAASKGRTARGDQIFTCKLTPDDVRSIRQRYATETAPELSKAFSISVEYVYRIAHKKMWKHVS